VSVSDVPYDRRGGLLNVVDVVVAPPVAFARLRAVPAWGWAFVVAALLGIAGILLILPASEHAMATWLPGMLAANPQVAKLPADQQAKLIQAQVALTVAFLRLTWIFVPIALLVATLLQALVMTVANAIGGGDGTFPKYFALAMTVAIVGNGLAALVTGVIATLRGSAAFDTPNAIQASLPSLALVVPAASGALRGFLAAFNVFSLWSVVLLAAGMQSVGRIRRDVAWAAAALILIATAAMTAFGARQG
jgi:hypothetical protein